MNPRRIHADFSVSPQIAIADMTALAAQGVRSIISNRPDGEEAGQPSADEIGKAAEAAGIAFRHVPVVNGKVTDGDVEKFKAALNELPKPALAFCRSGTRSATLWVLSQMDLLGVDAAFTAAKAAGYNLSDLRASVEATAKTSNGAQKTPAGCDVLIIGAGAAGIATAASLKKRRPEWDIVIVDPADHHAYQPGWTMVGGGIFKPADTVRPMRDIIPAGVRWERASVEAFDPEHDLVVLNDGRKIGYRMLVAAPGLKLDWEGVDGLLDTLGRNGVTSNYRYDTAPYTWQLVQNLRGGRALFTQPPMPIKCAGAPQKAMYLSGDYWHRHGRIKDVEIEFHNAGPVLFGVKDYIPALMEYVERYRAQLKFGSRLLSVDGASKVARFAKTNADGTVTEESREFDMIHVCPPQAAPDFVRKSPLATQTGWIDVDESSLRHKRYANVFSLGDVANTSNAKTAAAARKQAPVVAENVIASLDGKALRATYDGYGSCPLTVERGKIVLAEFGYGGKLLPTFPTWLIDGTRPSMLAWYLKAEALPFIYWNGMLKGREWLVSPKLQPSVA